MSPHEPTMKKEHLSTDKQPKSKEEKLDNQLRDSFPTSDPPSYSPGVAGSPKNRKSDATPHRQPPAAAAPKAHKTKNSGT